jgi:thiol-disulfide isomerase/thioredoxin
MKLSSLALSGLLLVTAAVAAPQQFRWAPTSDRGFDQAIENGKYIVQFFTEPRCAPCAKMERILMRDPEMASLVRQDFVAIRSDASLPEGAKDASNYGVEDFPTLLFFDRHGKQLEGATLQGVPDAAEIYQRFSDVSAGTFDIGKALPSTPSSGTSLPIQLELAIPASTGYSRPDTTRSIAPPPVPQDSSEAPR